MKNLSPHKILIPQSKKTLSFVLDLPLSLTNPIENSSTSFLFFTCLNFPLVSYKSNASYFLHLQFPFLKFKQSLSLFSTVFILSSNSEWLLSFSIYMAVCGSVSSTQHRAHHVAHTLSWQQPLCFRLPLSLCCLSSFTVSLFPSRYGYQAHASRSVQ